MRLFTGDECGLLKECIPELAPPLLSAEQRSIPNAPIPTTKGEDVGRRLDNGKELQTRRRGIVDLKFLSSHGGDNPSISLAALRTNGSVEFWKGSAKTKKSFGSYTKVHTTSSENVFTADNNHKNNNKGGTTACRPLGLGVFPQQQRVCAGDALGNLAILKYYQDDEDEEEDNNKERSNGQVVQRYNAYTTSKGGTCISYTPGNHANTQLATAMAFDAVHGRVAVGGRERETTLIDLMTGQVVFKAKNLPPDPQTLLQQPIWPSAILFLPHEHHNVLAVGTAYKQVRLYDVRTDSQLRRPTATTPPEPILDYRVTALCQVDTHHLVVGDTAGYLYNLDLRMLKRQGMVQKGGPVHKDLGRYVGPGGSVRQLQKHPTLPRMAVVGLDRMLRIYDTTTRKQLECIYLKQRLNCVAFGPEGTWSTKRVVGGEDDEAGDEDEEDDDQDGNGNPGDVDIDQEDVVEDYVDSDDDDKVDDSSNDDDDDDDEDDESEDDSDDDDLDDPNADSSDDADDGGKNNNDSDDDDDDDDDSGAYGSGSEDDRIQKRSKPQTKPQKRRRF
jgi:ribosome biogenesis protein NSA1